MTGRPPSWAGFAFLGVGAVAGCAGSGTAEPGAAGLSAPGGEMEYRLYVTNESSDIVSRVFFSPAEGARVEREIPVGIMPADTDAPHGVAVSPDGEFYYVTVAHGTPDGWLWKFRAGADTLVSRTTLGRFPASVGTSPDGQFVFVVNFNLHGDMAPSDVSVVYGPELTEVTRVVSCLMPHGSRTNVSGSRHYHVCMHSDQLVELDLATFSISSRFSLAPGREGRLERDDRGIAPDGHHARGGREGGAHPHDGPHGTGTAGSGSDEVCSPTWVAPGRAEGRDRFVYIACNRAHRVLEVDVDRWEVVRRWDTGRGPYNLEVSPDGRLLVVTLKGDQGVAVVDLEGGEMVAELETTRPITHGVVISPDSRYAFVTNESIGAVRGTMDVFDLARMERVASVELRHQPGGIDLWRVDPVGEGPRPHPR